MIVIQSAYEYIHWIVSDVYKIVPPSPGHPPTAVHHVSDLGVREKVIPIETKLNYNHI